MMLRQANIAGKRILQVLTCNVHILYCVMFNVHIVSVLRLLRQQTLREEDPVMRTALSAGHWTLDTRDVIQIYDLSLLGAFQCLHT